MPGHENADPAKLTRSRSALARLASGLRRWWPETSIVALGLWVRVRMLLRFDPMAGFDANDHLPYIDWFRARLDLPPLDLCRETYHPPLYYLVAGRFSRWAEATTPELGAPSVVFACLTLLLIWFGLERHLPGQRLARLFGLALAALMPSAIHMAGMISAEAMNSFWSVLALLLAAELLSKGQRPKAWVAPTLGLVLGLQMLTKISALVIIAAVGCGALLDLAWQPRERTRLWRSLRPWLMVAAVFCVTSGWYYARNQKLYGKAVLAGYDGVDKLPAEIASKPYFARRSLDYFVSFPSDIFRFPYYPVGTTPKPRFWPVLVASTFVDHYSYQFVASDPKSDVSSNGRPLPKASIKYARASVIGGALIAVTTMVAWVYCAVVCFRRRDALRLMLLLAPLGALVGQMHFATKYSYDHYGPVKGLYLLFATSPLFAVYGVAVAWLVRRRWGQPAAVVEALALLAVASYVLYASFA